VDARVESLGIGGRTEVALGLAGERRGVGLRDDYEDGPEAGGSASPGGADPAPPPVVPPGGGQVWDRLRSTLTMKSVMPAKMAMSGKFHSVLPRANEDRMTCRVSPAPLGPGSPAKNSTAYATES
jgi:hypothetical protein